MSKAEMTKGHGVLSVYQELLRMMETYYPDQYTLRKNTVRSSHIYHYHTINFPFFLALPFVKRKGKTVGFVHFVPKTLDESLRLWKIAKVPFYKYIIWFYKAMDRLVTVNPYFVGELEKYGIDRGKITYIPNCVSPDVFFEKPVEQKAALRRKFGLPADRPVIIGVGQLQIRKGVFDFFELAKRNPDKLFLWVGGFSFGKISAGYEEIKKMVDHPPENLRFAGFVNRDEMNDYYNASDILFLPSFSELFPMAILEALNCKLPVVLRDLPEYRGILSDYSLLCDDKDAFDREINRLCRDKAYYEEIRQRSKAGSDYYSPKNIAGMWNDFYQSL